MSFKNNVKNVKLNLHLNWLGPLGLILVVLKLFGLTAVATWSWWLVLLPFYFGFAVLFACLGTLGLVSIIAFLVLFVIEIIENIIGKK
jgi:hypothetical protein